MYIRLYCLGKCAYNNHFCWPGTCDYSGLRDDCRCATDFTKEANTGQTKCQPTKPPSILTCDTMAIGPRGEKKRAMSSANSTECKYLDDMYGNFQPSVMGFHMVSEFTIDVSGWTKPAFIYESKFGISDSTVYIQPH